MRSPVLLSACLVAASLAGAAHDPNECASVTVNGNEVTMRAESWDPVNTIGGTLAERYNVRVSVESPVWAFPGDTEDVAVADPEFSMSHGNVHYQVMKRHVVEIQFALNENGRIADVDAALHAVADAANQEMPYSYRLDASDDGYALVPTTTRDSHGDMQDATPLLDRKVTIPPGKRSIAKHAQIMADELSRQTGLHVSCCQAFVAGVPWGMAEITFEANNQPAREVLKALMRAEQPLNVFPAPVHPDYDHWSVRCDGTGAPWCFIEVEGYYPKRCE
jgi:hypothetical protein